jgi:hypothetical protein
MLIQSRPSLYWFSWPSQILNSIMCIDWLSSGYFPGIWVILRCRGNTLKTISHYNNMVEAWKLELCVLFLKMNFTQKWIINVKARTDIHLQTISYHIILFIFIPYILTGLKNPYGYGNRHICLRSQEVKTV